jgi:hypothetical protein
LQCTLEHTSLLNPEPYSALSYRWGEPTNTKQIILNERPVKVGANIEAALRQLQSHGYRRIWADALCINQNDLEERDLQIRNMQLVYSKAQNVVAWIGNDEENIATAVNFLWKTESFRWLPTGRPNECSPLSKRHIREMELQFGVNSSIVDEWIQQRWKIFGDFFNLDYWKRVWIIQELASGSDVKIIFGKTEISWKSIMDVVVFLEECSGVAPRTCQSYQNAALLRRFRSRFLSNVQAPITLREALQWSHYAEATDPRDKIYALLGLTSDGHKIVPLPNYQQPLEQIHEEMTKTMFAMERSLDFICMRGLNCHEDGQPSWVPDWAYYWSRPRALQEDRISRRKTSHLAIPIFEAQEPGILKTVGNDLGAVCTLSSSLSLTREAGARSSQKVELDEKDKLIPALLQGLRTNYPSGVANALSQNLCLDQLALSDNGTYKSLNDCTVEECFYNLWKLESREALQGLPLLRWLDENASLEIGSLSLQDWTQSRSMRSRLKRSFHIRHRLCTPWDRMLYTAAMERVLQGSMRLMVTETGFLGLAPPATQIGDRVCYIRGCSEPVILRKREKPVTRGSTQEYQVIGGAHIEVDRSLPRSSRFDEWADKYFGRDVERIILT